jgi:hypothetical protein
MTCVLTHNVNLRLLRLVLPPFENLYHFVKKVKLKCVEVSIDPTNLQLWLCHAAGAADPDWPGHSS